MLNLDAAIDGLGDRTFFRVGFDRVRIELHHRQGVPLPALPHPFHPLIDRLRHPIKAHPVVAKLRGNLAPQQHPRRVVFHRGNFRPLIPRHPIISHRPHPKPHQQHENRGEFQQGRDRARIQGGRRGQVVGQAQQSDFTLNLGG